MRKLYILIALFALLINSCDSRLSPVQPGLPEEDVHSLYDTFFSEFDADSFIADVIETHRAVGDYEKSVLENSWNDTTDAQKEALIADFKKHNVGNTGIADYINAFDLGASSGSIYAIAATGSGSASVPFKYAEDKIFTEGIKFNSIAIHADEDGIEPRKGRVTLDIVFVDDYSGCFSSDSSLCIKAGSEIFVTFDCSYGYLGEGNTGDNAKLTIESYSISTVDPNAGIEDMAVSHEPNGFIVRDNDIDYRISVFPLSGEAEGYFGLDYQVVQLVAIKTTVTLETIGIPLYESGSVIVEKLETAEL